jgi:hypothetical protein
VLDEMFLSSFSIFISTSTIIGALIIVAIIRVAIIRAIIHEVKRRTVKVQKGGENVPS